MLMKKIRIFFSATAALLLVAACVNKEELEGNGHGFDEATFTLSAVSVENTSATLNISSAGAQGATYYGFLTEDVTSEAAALVSKQVGAISVTRHILSSGNTSVTVKDLRQGGKAYRYIVTGLLANGTTYNDPVELSFTTSGDFTNNSVGTISYPEPLSEPTTVKFEGFPGKYVYGYSGVGFDLDALKKQVNKDLDSGAVKPVSGDQTVVLPIEEAGEYVVYAYELDEKGYPTLSCTLFPLNISSLDFSVYESYLGDWYVNGLSSMKVTIAEKQKNVSFTISGIPYTDVVNPATVTTFEPAVLNFDAATGFIYLEEQDLSTFTYGNYGTGMKTISGRFNYGGSVYAHYPFNAEAPGSVLFVGSPDDEGNIATVAGECNYGPFVSFSYGFVFVDGPNVGKGSLASETIEFPFTLTKTIASPTEEYLAWIGTWYTEGGDKFVIEEDVVNTSYSVTGFFDDLPVITRFNEADGTMSFYGQDVAEDEKYTYRLQGIDQDNYVEPGSQDGTSTLAIATLSADGKSFTIEGNEYEAVYGSTTYEEIIVGLDIFAFDLSAGNIYSVSDAVRVDLPATLEDTKPGPTDEYLAWIGDWEVGRGDETDTWTITENKTNTSYTVTGIEGAPFEVIADFDKETGALSISEQDVYNLTSGNENVLNVSLYGNFIYNGTTYFWGDDYELFVATIGEDGSAVMTPSPAAIYGDFVSFRFYGFVGPDYRTVAYTSVATPLPNVMTPATGAGVESTANKSVSSEDFIPSNDTRLNTYVAAPASRKKVNETRGIPSKWVLSKRIAR